MNVLAIGNSFSEDSMRYLHSIARADGVDLQTANLYIGGCSLERHYRNMLMGADAYELQYNGQRTGFFVSMKEALLNRKWDVVTVQQESSQSFNKDSYEPYISQLVEYVRKCAPKAKIYVHQTWAYEAGSDKLLKTAKYDTPENMLADIVSAYGIAANTVGADGIIRSGEMFGNLLKCGFERIHRDTYHATYGIGRYALGLLWYRTLCGADVLNNSFCDLDEPVFAEELEKVRRVVSEL